MSRVNKETKALVKQFGEDCKKEIDITLANSSILDGVSVYMEQEAGREAYIKDEYAGSTIAFHSRYHYAVHSIHEKLFENWHKVVINFGDYQYPGGKYLEHDLECDIKVTPEDELCKYSDLYNVMEYFDDSYYAYNRENLNCGLYERRGLYTPRVVFRLMDSTKYADVLTTSYPDGRRTEEHECETNDGAVENAWLFALSAASKMAKEVEPCGKKSMLIVNPIEYRKLGQSAKQAGKTFYHLMDQGFTKMFPVIHILFHDGRDMDEFRLSDR